MTKEQALEMLKSAPCGNEPSRVNPEMTQALVVQVVREGTECEKSGAVLSAMSEKRVYQACQNTRHPRY